MDRNTAAAGTAGWANYDFMYKILVVGDSGVGKSNLLLRFTDDTFSEVFISTIGVDFKFKTISLNDKTVKLQIWDTAGQERFRTVTTSFYRGAHGVLLVFDVTDPTSFNNITRWLKDIYSYGSEDIPMILIGNKSDLTTQRVVSESQAIALAQHYGLKYLEASAKLGTGVNEAFISLASDIMNKKLEKSSLLNNTVEKKGDIDLKRKRKQQKKHKTDRAGCCTII